ncbi:cell division protein FtsQ, partial [Streptomyces atroolivaceus]
MAGPTTAQRGEAGRADTPARPPHIGPEGRRLTGRTRLVLGGGGIVVGVTATERGVSSSSFSGGESIRKTST